MCVCPPAVMAGTVATVPAAKRAVHHLTAHHAPHPRHAVAAARPPAVRHVDCPPAGVAGLPAPIVTYAEPIPAEPGGDAGGPGGGGGGGGIGVGAVPAVAGVPVAAAPDVTPTPTPSASIIGAVPEPATWFLLIGGVGLTGAALRRRRRATLASGARLAGGTLLWGSGVRAEAGEATAAVALKAAAATVGKTAVVNAAGKTTMVSAAGKSTLAGVAGKAALCVCPAAVVAGSVMTVPPLRHAVHAATAPAPIPAAAPLPTPCPDGTVPVSATAIKGFPATVATAPAKS